MACIFALFKWVVSQILTKGEKRTFSASQKTLSGRPKTGMRHGEMHCAETNRDPAFVKINLPATRITAKNSYIRRQKKLSDAKRKTSVG